MDRQRAADLNRFLTRNAENLAALAEVEGIGERGDVYRLNDRFRIGIAETAETLAFELLARRDDGDEA